MSSYITIYSDNYVNSFNAEILKNYKITDLRDAIEEIDELIYKSKMRLLALVCLNKKNCVNNCNEISEDENSIENIVMDVVNTFESEIQYLEELIIEKENIDNIRWIVENEDIVLIYDERYESWENKSDDEKQDCYILIDNIHNKVKNLSKNEFEKVKEKIKKEI